MIHPSIIRAMLEAGATAEVIAAAVTADYEVSMAEAPLSGAERTRRWRYRNGDGGTGDVTPCDECDETPSQVTQPVTTAQPIETKTKLEKSSYINTTTLDTRKEVSSKAPSSSHAPSSPENLYPRCSSHSPGKGGTGGKPRTRAKVETSAEFDRFWAVYPRRVEKRKAMQAFLAAQKRATVEAIIAGAERYAREGTEPQYTKHPTTWLNGDCWLDEPMPFVAKKTKRDQMFEKIFAEIEERKGNVDGFADPVRGSGQRGLCGPGGFDADFELPAEAGGRPGDVCETIDYPLYGAAEGDFEADG